MVYAMPQNVCKHLNITIRGTVQGVFFRNSAKQEADKLGITGFVRNESDGSVYMEIEGIERQIWVFLAWCNNGSLLARVKEMQYVEEKILQNFTRFAIQ